MLNTMPNTVPRGKNTKKNIDFCCSSTLVNTSLLKFLKYFLKMAKLVPYPILFNHFVRALAH